MARKGLAEKAALSKELKAWKEQGRRLSEGKALQTQGTASAEVCLECEGRARGSAWLQQRERDRKIED